MVNKCFHGDGKKLPRVKQPLGVLTMESPEPEVRQLAQFLDEFNNESDRGAALVAASMLDERLEEILRSFFADTPASKDLLSGFNAPLGTFSARASPAMALGLLQEHEFKEITLIRKIRNEFGHGWQTISFESGRVADFCRQLPWLGPAEYEEGATVRARFNAAVAILLTDLLWRVRVVGTERRRVKAWPNRARGD
jgi:hypothetical protein